MEVVFGTRDEGLGFDMILHTTNLAVQCSTQRDFILEYHYQVEDRVCEVGEREIDGVCVWWGQDEAEFEINRYTDSSYVQTYDDETAEEVAGEMIYLGIKAIRVPSNTQWGVENCFIIESETSGSLQEHLLIDPSGTGCFCRIENYVFSCERWQKT